MTTAEGVTIAVGMMTAAEVVTTIAEVAGVTMTAVVVVVVVVVVGMMIAAEGGIVIGTMIEVAETVEDIKLLFNYH